MLVTQPRGSEGIIPRHATVDQIMKVAPLRDGAVGISPSHIMVEALAPPAVPETPPNHLSRDVGIGDEPNRILVAGVRRDTEHIVLCADDRV